MGAIFKVSYNAVCKGDKRNPVAYEDPDWAKTVSARDAEAAIAKVRASVRRETYEVVDDDGNDTGKRAKYEDIVVHSVDIVSLVDLP